jgi:glycosyltransferase involved in cell wall biosynthesis
MSTPAESEPRYSVVVPVFNELDNIGEFCRRALAELPPGYELLVCYDFDGDSTLPALAALRPDEKPPVVRLVKNDLGRGVRYAIEAGMRAARAPVVVVSMADLSDDFRAVPEMVRRAEAGADVVCASRYMRGGRQVGGPFLKGLLSRAAGVSLHWLAGLPTHDPTNSFKAYRRDFLQKTPIESPAGFCLGLELTAKAHFHGGRVEEVPAVWHDRSAGQSRFQLRRWLPLYLRWYFWALDRRYRPLLAAGLLSLAFVLVFLSNFVAPLVTGGSELDASWQQALVYAHQQGWRAGVDYVFTFGPLGYLLTWVFDPGSFAARAAWDAGITAVLSGLAVYLLRTVRPLWAGLVALLFFTVLAPLRIGAIPDCKYVLVVAGLAVGLLDRRRPNLPLTAAALGLFAALALTKFTFLMHTAVLGGLVLAHVAHTRGGRPAALLAGWSVAAFGLLWVGAGQSMVDLPTFLRRSLDQSNGYAEAMHLNGAWDEVFAAVAGALLLTVAAGLRTSGPKLHRLLVTAAVGWVLFVFFKGCFVRHEPGRVESFFWLLGALSFLIWPAVRLGHGQRRTALALLGVTAALGLYGSATRIDRWRVPSEWAEWVRRNADGLIHPSAGYAASEAQSQAARERADLPGVRAVVGDRSIDMVTIRPGLLIANGLNWTPRPVFQSYSAHTAELQRLNRDFFRGPTAPDFVLFRGETIDGRLPTQDDGPTLLELLRRYEPRTAERGYLLLERRAQSGPDPLGDRLLERSVRFGEEIDLAALGPGPKAVSFRIDPSPLGRAKAFLYRPPTVYLRVRLTGGEVRTYRLVPGMVQDPVLIDPLPATPDDFQTLFTTGLRPGVAGVTPFVARPGEGMYFAETVACTVWSVRCLREPVGAR